MSNYYNLGNYTRAITTGSADAQRWFDRGLVWNYGYHHEEAIECFKRALEYDAQCLMAYWGIAYASGPNYNRPWSDFDGDDRALCLTAAATLQAQLNANPSGTNAIELSLAHALMERYPSTVETDDFSLYNDQYAAAMRSVYKEHSDDPDICALFAEALMNRTPWQLWDLHTGDPAEGADTEEAIDVLEKAIAKLSEQALQQGSKQGSDRHPGLLHMYLHLMEMSPHPEKALEAGDALIDLVPDAGHLQHMPTHIDVLCGDYANVVSRNHKAILADNNYLEQSGALNFYTLYRCHNYHFKIYGAMFLGQLNVALTTAETLAASLTPDVVEPLADWVEGFYPMKQHVLIRFGQWEQIKYQPLPDDQDLYAFSTALIQYSKAVANAATGDLVAADKARDSYFAARDRMPATRTIFNNLCVDILAVAEAMMAGEIDYRKGNFDAAFQHLRHSVELDDNLPYDEPWGWMQPSRHALGALLMEQSLYEDAALVYQADLGFDKTLPRACQHPNNIWSLVGLYECLTKLGRLQEASLIKPAMDKAKARADVDILYSCYCRGL